MVYLMAICKHFVFWPHISGLCLEIVINKERMHPPSWAAMFPFYTKRRLTTGYSTAILPSGEETKKKQPCGGRDFSRLCYRFLLKQFLSYIEEVEFLPHNGTEGSTHMI